MKNIKTYILTSMVLSIQFLYATVIHIPANQPTIQAGLNNAVEGDTVQVAPGIYYENIIWPETNGIKLIGSGQDDCVIDGDSASTVIRFGTYFNNLIDSSTVIKEFTIQHGFANGSNWPYYCGGGIFCVGDPHLENLTIANNSANSNGGGVFFKFFDSNLINCTFSENHCNSKGGGIYFDFSNPVLNNLVIKNNYAGDKGGGIYNDSELTFSADNRCNIYSNNSSNRGNGADIFSNNFISVIVDTFTVLNPTNYHASPIANFSFDILNSINNQVDADLYISPTGDDSNDGLTPETPLKTIQHALSIIIADNQNPHTLYLANGIYSPSTTGEIFPIEVISYVSFSGESETGVILDAEGVNRVMRINYAEQVMISNLTLTGGLADEGGGIFIQNSDVVITNTSVLGNTSEEHGGGIYFYYSEPTLIGVTIKENSSFDLGGGCYLKYSDVFLENVTIKENIASHRGGGIFVYSGDMLFDNNDRCNIYSNNLLNRGYGVDIYSYYNNNVVVVDTFTVANPTDYYISPIENFSYDILNSIIPLIDADLYVSPNGSNDNDGLTPETPLKTIQYAISTISAEITNLHTIFLANGIYSPSTNGEFFPVNISEFVSLIGESETGVILDAEQVAGVMELNYTNHSKISEMTLTGGLVDGGGGGISCSGVSTIISNITVVENSTTGYGAGGISINGGSNYGAEIILQNVTVNNNMCELSSGSGGIFVSNSHPIFNNCLIFNNNASMYGGGVYLLDSDPVIINTLIIGNSADYGSGIRINRSHPIIINCIIRNNFPQPISFNYNSYGEISSILIDHSNIQNSQGAIYDTGDIYWLDGNIDLNPLFRDIGNDDYSFQYNSPCINAGTSLLVWEGDTLLNISENEYYGSAPDMGPFEFFELMPGDINFDTQINVYDVIVLINFILDINNPSPEEYRAADTNSDEILDVLDVLFIINIILER